MARSERMRQCCAASPIPFAPRLLELLRKRAREDDLRCSARRAHEAAFGGTNADADPDADARAGADADPDASWSPIEAARFGVCDSLVVTLTRRPDEPGETRFASEGVSAKYLHLTSDALGAAVVIVDGACATIADCHAKLARQEDGLKKSNNFVRRVSAPQNKLHLALVLVKQQLVVDPFFSTSERGSHCSAPLLCGPFGDVEATRRRLMRSVVRLNMAGALERGAWRSTWHGALVRRLSSAVVLGLSSGGISDARRACRFRRRE